jgi:lipopolysaccharide heptosyltransferase I
MSKNVERILVIKTSSLGDVIHCFPAVSLLKKLNPNASIDWLVNRSLAEVAGYHPDVDEIIRFDRAGLSSPSSFLKSLSGMRNSLKKNKYDYIIDFQGLMRNALAGFMAGSGVMAGFDEPKEPLCRLFYGIKIQIPPDKVHAVEKNCALAGGIFSGEFETPPFAFSKNPETAENVLKILKDCGADNLSGIAAVSPCARWESKMWPPEFFANALSMAAEEFPSLDFVLIGSSADSAFCSGIKERSGLKKVHNLAGKTSLKELIELIRLSRAMLCVDSGPMHIAAALGVPVLALFGPTDPLKTGPYGKQHIIFQAKEGCIKCFKRYCPRVAKDCVDKIKVEDFVSDFKHKIKA